MKYTYKTHYRYIDSRLWVDAWDIYNQIINVLPKENADELLASFNHAENALVIKLKKETK